ncbi:uncharacterized protein LOC134257557 [Saccostrea cucullata]|uniref:uncharacterized protein LOC134257557 n=1 Tax=Saccostrea cuccullata TaxID=36930 RepID=UPI002ED0445C
MSKKRTGKFCVAAGCTSTHKDNVSLHDFPKESKRPDIRRQWIAFVKTKRKDFTSPTPHSVLCEKHFAVHCYPMEYMIKRSIGMEVKKKSLLPDAVPTIHLIGTVNPLLGKRSSSDVDAPTTSRPSQQKKIRSAFLKRECFRAVESQQSQHNEHEHVQCKENESHSQTDCIKPDDQEIYQIATRSIGLQISESKNVSSKRSKRCQTNIKKSDKVTQVNMDKNLKLTSTGIQCNRDLEDGIGKQHPCQKKMKQTPLKFSVHDDSIDEYSSEVDEKDPDFEPNFSDDCQSNSSINENYQPWKDRKFIVFESRLLELFQFCPSCSAPALFDVKRTVGSMVKIEQACGGCGFNRIWESQPMIGSVPAGNLIFSAALLFTGLLPSKTIRFMEQMNVSCISSNTFFQHQKYYLHPSICSVWRTFQENYFTQMAASGKALTLGGDGRADTPGHSAKYGSYGLLDLDLMIVIHIELVQSNEVKSSYHMEKEGFVRSINLVQSKGLKIGEIVTDRHVQIVKYAREELPNTKHYFDVWHVAKGLKKKLVALSKEKNCEALQPWIRSMCNHLYWVPASTPSGNGQLMLEKWESIVNHVQNIHEHDGQLYTECSHGPLEGREQQKKWLIPGSKAAEKFSDIATSKQMKKDVQKLSPGAQTASLEGYHAVVNHFAPKMIGFSYHGMKSRIILAALHFNENAMREQASTKEGRKRYDVIFPKFKKRGIF